MDDPHAANMLQDHNELAAFVAVLRQEGVRSYLEIGAKWGGSLRWIALSLPAGSRIVAVDLPHEGSNETLTKTVEELKVEGYDAHLIWGDSADPKTIEAVRGLGPFDAVFIDANHSYAYVLADWLNYRDSAKIVAFHDIAWHRAPEWLGTRIDVPRLWREIKDDYRHEEFKFCRTGKNNGIGVLWR